MPDKGIVLFVDDDVAVLDGIRRLLRGRPKEWEARFVSDADEALDEMRRSRIDAVVLDLKMPGKGGFELLKTMRAMEATRDIPVAILTGSQEQDLKHRALDLGATDLLNKPINVEDLLVRISSMLRLKAYEDELKSLNADLERRVVQRTRDLINARLDIVWRLAKAGEYRDDETGNHIVRVGLYCRIIAEEIGMTRDFVRSVFLTAPLHDIGKIGIPDSILLKPGPLTQVEWNVMRQHCEIGERILCEQAKGSQYFQRWEEANSQVRPSHTQEDLLTMASVIAKYHHERWDGTGYPNGLTGEDIPLEARIVNLADIYDALCSKRPYKSPYSHAEAMEIMRLEASSGLFDPVAYEAFEATHQELRVVRTEMDDSANGDRILLDLEDSSRAAT